MIKCPVCGFENPEDAAVCLNCGAPVEYQQKSQAIDDISEEQTIMIGQAPPSMAPPPPPPSPAIAPPPPSPAFAPPPPPMAAPAPPPPPQMNAAPPPPPSPGPGIGGGFQPQVGMPQGPPANMPNGVVYIVLSAVTTFFCCYCFPLGIAALVFAILGKVSEGNGDYEKAISQYKLAKILIIIGATLGFLLGIVSLFLNIISQG